MAEPEAVSGSSRIPPAGRERLPRFASRTAGIPVLTGASDSVPFPSPPGSLDGQLPVWPGLHGGPSAMAHGGNARNGGVGRPDILSEILS
jgi:hypothetical protein